MSAIGPGDWVEAVHSGDGRLQPGALYHVTEIRTLDGDYPCGICLRWPGAGPIVAGVRLDDSEAWCPCTFRPIRDGQERIERKALKKVCEPA